MNKIKLFTFAVVASLASCSSDPVGPNPNFPADGVIRVTAGLNDPIVNPISRAGINDPDQITYFNLKIQTRNSPGDKALGYDPNYSYYALMKQDAQKNCESFYSGNMVDPTRNTMPLTMLWKNENAVIDVVALALAAKDDKTGYKGFINVPSSAFETGVPAEVSENQTDVNVFTSNDLLYMPSKDYKATELVGQKLSLNFSHRFSKIQIKMKFDQEFALIPDFTAADILNLAVAGTSIKGTFYPVTDALILNVPTAEKPTFKSISPYLFSFPGTGKVGTDPAVYECIVLPQELFLNTNPFNISFNIKGQSYVWSLQSTSSLPKLEKGHMYTIELTVGKKVVALSKITAERWTEVAGGDITVK